MEDQDIIAGIRRGEVELFRLLVERYHRPLLSFIHSITRDHMLTEDIGQSVFLSFFKQVEKFDETRSTPVIAWLYVAARNLAVNAIKRERRYIAGEAQLEQWQDERPGPIDLLIGKEDHKRLTECLALLDEPYRSTLRAAYRAVRSRRSPPRRWSCRVR